MVTEELTRVIIGTHVADQVIVIPLPEGIQT